MRRGKRRLLLSGQCPTDLADDMGFMWKVEMKQECEKDGPPCLELTESEWMSQTDGVAAVAHFLWHTPRTQLAAAQPRPWTIGALLLRRIDFGEKQVRFGEVEVIARSQPEWLGTKESRPLREILA